MVGQNTWTNLMWGQALMLAEKVSTSTFSGEERGTPGKHGKSRGKYRKSKEISKNTGKPRKIFLVSL